MASALRQFDLKEIRDSRCHYLVGADEAGRGALAGPVVSAAVMVPASFYGSSWCRRRCAAINDSKQVALPVRESIYEDVLRPQTSGKLVAAVGVGSVREIEEHNILGATRISLRRAIEEVRRDSSASILDPNAPEVGVPPASVDSGVIFPSAPDAPRPAGRPISLILIDGLPLRPFPFPHRALVKGDGRSLAIALASIVAKVTRDAIMRELDDRYPAYGFARHKGYGTKYHRQAVLAHGPTPVHRTTFLRKLLVQSSQATLAL
jgi:ribonuclease HII